MVEAAAPAADVEVLVDAQVDAGLEASALPEHAAAPVDAAVVDAAPACVFECMSSSSAGAPGCSLPWRPCARADDYPCNANVEACCTLCR